LVRVIALNLARRGSKRVDADRFDDKDVLQVLRFSERQCERSSEFYEWKSWINQPKSKIVGSKWALWCA